MKQGFWSSFTTGPTGAQGPQGFSVLSGSTPPSNLIGIDGDQYINSATGDLYFKVGGAWTLIGSLIGPTVSIGQIDGGTPSAIYGGTFLIFGGTP
jgi:hypothetical protein